MSDKVRYYRGNPNLLLGGEDQEYTEEQINEIIKCRDSYEYFIYNYVKIKTKKGLEKPEVRPYQQRILKTIHDNYRTLVMAGRQCGKSLSTAMYIAWYICFHDYKTVGVVANKERVAKLILASVKNIFTNLPLFLKPGVEQWGTTEIKLDNNSVVTVSACSADALTGYTLNMLICDEVSKIPKNKANDFFDSVLPTVEADENAKIICLSTPKGINIWYKMWTEAEQGISGYSTVRVEWHEPPGRDEEWRKKKIAEKGLEYFAQEYSCDFLGSAGTLLKTSILQALPVKRPLKIELDECLKIYQLPIKEHIYVVLCDVSEGLGKDYSTIQVLDVTQKPYSQVCVYRNNNIKPLFFHDVINSIGKQYNNGLVIIENNSIGMEVLHNLNYESEYENIFYDKDFGIRTTKKSKSLGCSNFSFLMDQNTFDICDYDTIQELSRFVRKGASYAAQDTGDTDDLVMPLIIFSYFLLTDEYRDNWLETVQIEKPKEELEESFIVIFADDGLDN